MAAALERWGPHRHTHDLWELTFTAGYKSVKSFETGLEYRHDQSDGRRSDRPGRSAKSQDIIATEFIYQSLFIDAGSECYGFLDRRQESLLNL
jgi:hypothetical protein